MGGAPQKRGLPSSRGGGGGTLPARSACSQKPSQISDFSVLVRFFAADIMGTGAAERAEFPGRVADGRFFPPWVVDEQRPQRVNWVFGC